jgi:hypothetical protein
MSISVDWPAMEARSGRFDPDKVKHREHEGETVARAVQALWGVESLLVGQLAKICGVKNLRMAAIVERRRTVFANVLEWDSRRLVALNPKFYPPLHIRQQGKP